MRRNKIRIVDIYSQEATFMYDCIYAGRGYCGIKRNMDCDNDCSYYVEREPDNEIKVIDEEEEKTDPMEKVFDDSLLSVAEGITSCDDEEKEKGGDPMEKTFEEAVAENKRALREINRTFKIFLNDLKAKYLDKPTVKDENENDKIGGTD